MYVGLMALLLTMIWAQGSNMGPWLLVAVLPAILGVYLSRSATITVRGPSDGSAPNANQIEAEWEATASPFTPRLIGLLALLTGVIAGTALIVKQSTHPDSAELVDARTTCSASWAEFELDETLTTQQSWTECLLRNPSLVSACDLSAQLASAMLGVDSIDDVRLDSPDLLACGDDIY